MTHRQRKLRRRRFSALPTLRTIERRLMAMSSEQLAREFLSGKAPQIDWGLRE